MLMVVVNTSITYAKTNLSQNTPTIEFEALVNGVLSRLQTAVPAGGDLGLEVVGADGGVLQVRPRGGHRHLQQLLE